MNISTKVQGSSAALMRRAEQSISHLVVAAVAVLPKDCTIMRLNDSKNCRKNAGKNYFWKSKKRQLPTELEL